MRSAPRHGGGRAGAAASAPSSSSDRDGVIAGVCNHELQVSKHLDQVLHFVRKLAGQGRRST